MSAPSIPKHGAAMTPENRGAIFEAVNRHQARMLEAVRELERKLSVSDLELRRDLRQLVARPEDFEAEPQ